MERVKKCILIFLVLAQRKSHKIRGLRSKYFTQFYEMTSKYTLSQARLTVIINTGLVNMMDLDHRIVPWDTVRSRAVLVSVLHQDEVTWTRDPSRDILLWPGHTATITAYPHLTNNKGTLPNMVECRSEPFPYMGRQAYSR